MQLRFLNPFSPALKVDRTQNHHARFIYITGCDGTGKSTQVALLMERLRAQGADVHHVWLRFPFMLSLPLLAYARWRGYSRFEDCDYVDANGQPATVRHGYWEFQTSRLLRWLLPWTLLADAALAGLVHIYWPLWQGKTVVCERFVLDMLVDLSVAFGAEIQRRLPGRLYRWLLPNAAPVVILYALAETIQMRRPDLMFDKQLARKIAMYQRIIADYGLTQQSSEESVAKVAHTIWEASWRDE